MVGRTLGPTWSPSASVPPPPPTPPPPARVRFAAGRAAPRAAVADARHDAAAAAADADVDVDADAGRGTASIRRTVRPPASFRCGGRHGNRADLDAATRVGSPGWRVAPQRRSARPASADAASADAAAVDCATVDCATRHPHHASRQVALCKTTTAATAATGATALPMRAFYYQVPQNAHTAKGVNSN
ncbi:hypothetical protein CXG81DRAFT_19419 [Caulochytrium protostelioides]|uniref:Uncharacterized protein n=1 Tax=Caulochytrium protostelioides TaxID=1555241 RepID=A0A4P9X646_9FUNG|nr:hypothetical protein CXG81DRAFT_19419 [Caulochytrium protostelioides]|eukprot:RKP00646.1 hypothetical protein CXG81DRAFT_19419 [Caulochytrium protostelioides]